VLFSVSLLFVCNPSVIMKVVVFSTKPYDRQFFEAANATQAHELVFVELRLTVETSVLAAGFPVVCAFVNDQLDAPVLQTLARQGTRLIALRCAGFNHVDLVAARDLGLTVAHVPAYSPYAVAEHTLALILALNRKLHRAYARVREGNFSLDGLLGFDLHGRTVGIIGTGKIGTVVARILRGFGCEILAHDITPNTECEALGVRYMPLLEVLAHAAIVTLHCPLTPQTAHLINGQTLRQTKRGVMLINTSRGGLIDTRAVIAALKSGHMGALGLDVYEEEAGLFFENLSNQVIPDDVFSRLLTFPNVIVTSHQGFFTREAMENIAVTTLTNISDFARDGVCTNSVTVPQLTAAVTTGKE
jgi:D-lactate dehydrogenase